MAINNLVSWSENLRKIAEKVAVPTSLLGSAYGFGKNLFKQNPEIPTSMPQQTNQNNLLPVYNTAMSQSNQPKTSAPIPSIPDSVPVENLTSSTYSPEPISLPQQSGSSLVSGVKSITTPVLGSQQEIESVQAKQGGIQQQLLDAIRGLSGKGQALQSQYEAMGIPTQEKQLADINTQIAQRTAEYDNLMTSLEGQGRGIPLSIIRGQQGAVARQKAVEIGGLAAVQQAIQGNISSAKKTASEAVDLEYQDRLTEISALQQQLDFIDKDLTSAEKKRSEELSIALENQKAEIEAEREEKKSISELMLKAAENGADSLTLQRIMSSASLNEAIVNAGDILAPSDLDDIYKSLQIQKLQQDIYGAEDTMDISNPYISAISNAAIGLSENQRNEIIKNLNNYLQSGNTKGAQDLILRTAFQGQTGTAREDAIKRTTAINALRDVKELLAQYKAKSGDTGIIKGSYQDLAQKLGRSGDPELAGIGTRITQALQIYRNAVTGAAWGEQETAEYKRVFPSYKNESKLNDSIIDNMITALENTNRFNVEAYVGSGNYDAIFNQPKTFNNPKEFILYSNENKELFRRAKEQFPDYTPDEILQIIQQQDFNQGGSGTPKATSYLKQYGQITGINGSPYWKWGLDVDLKKGDKVTSPYSGKVVFAGKNGGFGNQVKIKLSNGYEVWLSHLDKIGVKQGQKVKPNQLVGLGGNTGKVIAVGGGDGSHLDITIKKPSGSYLTAQQVKQFLS